MNVADLVRAMETIAPTRLAAPWDNVGLLIGDPDREVSRVLLAVDCTRPVFDEAVRGGYGAIVAYHPPIFEAQRRFVAGSIAYDAAHAQVAIYSPHTAFDVVDGGTNDVLADALGMTNRAPLREVAVLQGGGFGRIGAVPRATVHHLVEQIKRALGITHVLVAGALDAEVTRAAVCAGSGTDFVEYAIGAGAGLLLTGELRHHDALRAVASRMAVVCTLHSASERVALIRLQKLLSDRLPGVPFECSIDDREPFAFA
jgi:dinuclear metal center YbgI/SA1388 family protein